jgi:hypothetical protein
MPHGGPVRVTYGTSISEGVRGGPTGQVQPVGGQYGRGMPHEDLHTRIGLGLCAPVLQQKSARSQAQ